MNDPTVVAAIIAAAVALTIGILGSIFTLINEILSHRLTQRRESQKYFGEVYRELFAPVISDVFLYIDMASQSFEPPPPERQVEVKDRAISHIRNRLVYASPKLISSFHGISYFAIGDESGANPTTAEINFLYNFVQEYIEVINRTSIFSNNREREQISSIIQRLILYLLHTHDLTALTMYHFQFASSSYTHRNHQKIKKLLDNYDKSCLQTNEDIERKRHEHERSLNGKPEQERVDALNAVMTTEYRKANQEYQQLRERLIGAILERMIVDKSRQQEVMQWIFEA